MKTQVVELTQELQRIAANKADAKSGIPDMNPIIGATLTWKPCGTGYRLFDGKRRFGDVVPDAKHAGMWRCVLSGGRLSDMANLSWARNAVLEAATRELEYEARQREGIDPAFTGQLGGVSEASARYVRRKRAA